MPQKRPRFQVGFHAPCGAGWKPEGRRRDRATVGRDPTIEIALFQLLYEHAETLPVKDVVQ